MADLISSHPHPSSDQFRWNRLRPWYRTGMAVSVGAAAVAFLPALPAGGRLERDGLLELLRRHQRALLAGMAWLSAPLTA